MITLDLRKSEEGDVLVVRFVPSDWQTKPYKDVIYQLEVTLIERIEKGELVRVVIEGNPDIVGDLLPPKMFWMRFVRDVFLLTGKIYRAVTSIAVYNPTTEMDAWFNMLRAPVPLKFFKDLDAAWAWRGP